MPDALTIESIPLSTDADGVIRVAGTRVTLDTLLAAFTDGATAEEIVQQYPSVSLAAVYQVLGYCLQHTSDIESYLTRRRKDMSETRNASESRWPPEGIRERLLARRA